MAPVKTSASGSRIRKKIESDGKVMTEAEAIEIYHLTKRDIEAVHRVLEEVRRRRRKPPVKARSAK